METGSNEKKTKITKTSAYSALRVKKETRKRVLADLAKVNRKDYGRKVHADEYIAIAVSLVTPEHVQQLQEASLSNADHLEREYRAYVAKNGPIEKDEYLGKRLRGEISPDGSPKSQSLNFVKSA